MKYDAAYIHDGSDNHSASLKAFENLAREKGYQLVATSLCGYNAFFVQKDLTENKFPEPATAENLYNSYMSNRYYISGHPSHTYIGK
jgi:hypothetical protein